MPTTPEAVALGHLATHVDDLAIPGKLSEDSANSQGLELLNWSFSSVRRCRWGSCLRDLLFVVHARAYLTRLSILNIGRYIEITITPTMAPTMIIISGSMIEVSVAIDESTSSS